MAPLINLKITKFLVLLMSLILTYQASILALGGRMVMESLLAQEDEIQRLLLTLNKLPIKTIHAPWGETYDCIEFHKQPAFDHPLLKNHKREMTQETVSTTSDQMLIGQVDGCLRGTVPIRRTTREDIIRAKSLSSSLKAPGAQCRAGVTYDPKHDETIYGARGVFNVWSPTVNQDQFSSAEMALQSSSAVIEFGWT
ncbi:hypothetical protein MKW94_004542, partial [Papaver nudicaule]|nr:hypothetical protein [Papaver nudicaule]